ncbi:uncharacterized protein LOC142368757 [Odontesthes bonariensis]|uniref:uncharacterized protein LOC142368757 n=1 Tax=Odontesthes bonariensis TaxID=219752 RepID=UPI003F581CBD
MSKYQQSLGSKPHTISSWMKDSEEPKISPKYRKRFQVDAQKDGINNLIIRDLHLSDSGRYFCGILEFSTIEFGQGVFLHVKTSLSNTQSSVHQPAVEQLRLGDSVNLSCTVYAESCAGEQTLYWFRHGASQPAVMYPSNRQCTSLSNEQPDRKNCTLKLEIKSVLSFDAATYYCALASCGEVVFGNGTRVEILGSTTVPTLLVYCLLAALTVSIVVLFVLGFVMYKLKSKLCSDCKGTASHPTCSLASDYVQSHNADNLHYAALSLKRNSDWHHREDSTESVCVYSREKSRK